MAYTSVLARAVCTAIDVHITVVAREAICTNAPAIEIWIAELKVWVTL
jgi:hypothetical protein